jgi:phosphoribosyl-dephospho-CoA transferase
LQISEYISDMLVFLDESAANEHTMNRKHEWASFEISLTVIRPVKRSERYSVLSTYCVDEILATHIHQDSIDASRFEWFLREEILSRCNAFSDLKSVLIMNNASIHHSKVSWSVN